MEEKTNARNMLHLWLHRFAGLPWRLPLGQPSTHALQPLRAARACTDSAGEGAVMRMNYDEQLPIAQIKELIDTACRFALLISTEQAERLVDEIARTDAFMPFTDPTGYRAISRNIPGHLATARAFLAFRRELERELSQEHQP